MRIILWLLVFVAVVAAVVAALVVRRRRRRARIIRLDWPPSRSSQELASFCAIYLRAQGWEVLHDVDRVGLRGKGRALWIICRAGGKRVVMTNIQDAMERTARTGGTDVFLTDDEPETAVRAEATARSIPILGIADLATLEERLPARRRRPRPKSEDGMEAAMMGEPGGAR